MFTFTHSIYIYTCTECTKVRLTRKLIHISWVRWIYCVRQTNIFGLSHAIDWCCFLDTYNIHESRALLTSEENENVGVYRWILKDVRFLRYDGYYAKLDLCYTYFWLKNFHFLSWPLHVHFEWRGKNEEMFVFMSFACSCVRLLMWFFLRKSAGKL